MRITNLGTVIEAFYDKSSLEKIEVYFNLNYC